MNDIVLLVTGVLATKQPNPPIVPTQPAIQLNKGVTKSTQGESYQLVSSVKITPPEFAPINENYSAIKSAIKTQKNLIKKTKKILTKDLYSVAEFNNFQAVKVKFPREPRLIAQQIRQEIAIARRYQRFRTRTLPNLRFGNSGLPVRVLQRLLLANGYAVRVDGVYGALTESAVKAFQNQRNLRVDGVVGPGTWYALAR